jgi:hypothetical protein
MPVTVKQGCFYEFHRSRSVNRPGAEIFLINDSEIGREVAEKDALKQVRSGRDMYTPFRADAYRLACSASEKGEPRWDGAHESDRYFPHYHPDGKHTKEWKRKASEGRPISDDAPGHVYWGNRGELKGRSEGK